MTIPPTKSKHSRWLKRIFLLAIVGGILYFCSFITAIHLVGATDHTENADVIIVLGAGLRRDGRPGWALTRRTIGGADLWKAGVAPYLLCTGGQAEGYPRSEADACQSLLLAEGVPADVIWIEDQSRSTEENALYSRQIMAQRNLNTAVLVSDSYHLLRAEWIFRSQGIQAYTSPIPASRINRPIAYPSYLIREFLAFHWYVVKNALGIPVTHIYGI